MMQENEILASPRRRVKQSISVPFLWEEKPGTLKREWPMNQPTQWIIAPSPSRLVVSIPFQWEEEPGKPHLAANHFVQKDETSSEGGSECYDDWYSSLSETDGNGFVEKVLRESDAKKSWSEERQLAVKRTLTLEELMLLSRKLSYTKKTVDMKKKKGVFMEFIKESLPACFTLKTANRQNNVPITSISRHKVKKELSLTP